MIGTRLGRFRIVAKLGEGGMATVWRAEDELLGRTVAVKVLAGHLANSASARRRFLEEAKNASTLDHPGVVPVFDFQEDADVAWMAMGLVDGETISDIAIRGPFDHHEAARVVALAAEALQHAHDRGIVHRDVTGRNIMVSRDARVLVLDFGLARAAGAQRLTSTGTMLGTVAYIAPEVAQGRPATERSDVYGLGVVLYETLTGTLPFQGDRPEAMLYSIVHEPLEPPTVRDPSIPVALEKIVLDALARDPGTRTATPWQLASSLREFASLSAGSGQAGTVEVTDHPADNDSVEIRATPRLPDHIYLVVLPFRVIDSSDDPDGERSLFAGGCAEVLSSALSQHAGLRVIPPSMVPHTQAGPSSVAKELGANLVLQGNVQQAGDKVRVTFAVLHPASGIQLSGGSVDGWTFDLFELEDRLVASVMNALRIGTLPDAKSPRKGPRDPAAHERYLQALGYLQRYEDESAVNGAVGILERLTESEPGSATLFASLGRAYLFKHRLTMDRAWQARAAQVSQQALDIDSGSADVLLTLGEIHLDSGNSALALNDFERALELRPTADAWIGLARARAAMGELQLAETACGNAIDLSPFWWGGYNWLGKFRFDRGHYSEAIRAWREVARLTPDNPRVYYNIGAAYVQLNAYKQAMVECERSIALLPSARAFRNLGTALFAVERHDEAIVAFRKATALQPADPMTWGNLGSAIMKISGWTPEACEALERAVALQRQHLSLHGTDALGWGTLALWLSNLIRYEESAPAIGRALDIAPWDVHVQAMAVGVYARVDKRLAIHWMREAIRGGYTLDAVHRNPELEPLYQDPEFLDLIRNLKQRPETHPVEEAPE